MTVADLPGTNAAPAADTADSTSIDFHDSDIIIGLVGPVGTEWTDVTNPLRDCFHRAGYTWDEIRVSRDIIGPLIPVSDTDEASRIIGYMDAGDKLRKINTALLADGVAAKIAEKRAAQAQTTRHAFVVNSLKHPDEVTRLRRIYGGGFYLIGVQPDDSVKMEFMRRTIAEEQIPDLIKRDADDRRAHGQRVNDTFHLADFFVRMGVNKPALNSSLSRICNILFGHPYSTPTFDEFAMFLAFASSLRSADLSRQVGAVVAADNTVLSTGGNDTPRYGGGLYWPEYNESEHRFEDALQGRDYKWGGDSNRIEQDRIISEIVEAGRKKHLDESVLRDILDESAIRDLTEYGRVVHAEMEALLSCARNGVDTVGASLFCTTFPCHNCAKHIVAAGIRRVVFIEPYRKSKAPEFHPDSISVGPKVGPIVQPAPKQTTVSFEPFIGVGPRRFFDLFSMRLGAGTELRRKDKNGRILSWSLGPDKNLRVQMRPGSYVDLEKGAAARFDEARSKV